MNPQRRLSVSAVVGAMGIVYGDIGTSPLYALESALDAAGGFDAEVVLGVLSLVFWSLTISVTLKYVTVIMRADNEGEGGILALFALAQRRLITGSTWAKVAVGLDRKSTRLNSSHGYISDALFCLKKKIIAEAPEFDAVRLVVAVLAAQIRQRRAFRVIAILSRVERRVAVERTRFDRPVRAHAVG